jgi:segregation and condensation protein A
MDNSQQLHLALVNGDLVIDRPEDLYIPPDALKVFLEEFEGPLDFLLYLIRKQKFDILNLPILQITEQYVSYINLMKNMDLELAAEYLVMAAILTEIKSRLLLPQIVIGDEIEEDPRAKLIEQLIEYEKYKLAAQDLDSLPRLGRDASEVWVEETTPEGYKLPEPEVDIDDLLNALNDVIRRTDNFQHHVIKKEALSTRERMSKILDMLKDTNDFIEFEKLFTIEEGKAGIVVTFLAILELTKEDYITLNQPTDSTAIFVKSKTEKAFDELYRDI